MTGGENEVRKGEEFLSECSLIFEFAPFPFSSHKDQNICPPLPSLPLLLLKSKKKRNKNRRKRAH